MRLKITEETKKIERLVKEYFYWLMKIWPLFVMLELIVFHSLLLAIFAQEAERINVIVSSLYQIFGGGYIVLQIDSNLKILSNGGLIDAFKTYINQRPKKKIIHHTVISDYIPLDVKMSGHSFPATIAIRKMSAEERFNLLSKQIQDVEKKIEKTDKALRVKIAKEHTHTSILHNSLKQEVRLIEDSVVRIVVGDYKKVFLGILMISYGVLIPVINELRF